MESSARSNWHLSPSLTLSETYDNNIYSTTTEVEDFVTKAGGSFAATYNSANIDFSADYLVEFNSYARYPELNVLTQNGSIDIDLNRWFRKFFKEAIITVTEDFTFTPDLRDYYFDERREQVGSLSSYGVRTARTDSYRNAFSLAIGLPLSQRLHLDMRYSNLLTEYSDPVLRDNVTHSASVGNSYIFPKDVIYGDMGIRNTRADGIDSNIYSLRAGIRHSFSTLTSIDIHTGGNIQDYEIAENVTTISGGLSLNRRSRNFTYNIGYQRELNPASGISRIPTVSQLFYLNIRGVHTRNLTSSIGANYAVNKSERGEDIDTQSYNLSAGLSYLIRPWLQGTISASHSNQASETPAALDIERDRIILQFSALWGR